MFIFQFNFHSKRLLKIVFKMERRHFLTSGFRLLEPIVYIYHGLTLKSVRTA